MHAYTLGPVTVRFRPSAQAWIVTRETWLRIAYSEAEARLFARQMASVFGQPLTTVAPVAIPD